MPDQHLMTCMQIWGGNSLTTSAVSISGLDVWIHSTPHAHSPAGGDVYFLSSCATGRITRLLLADVSGHGPSAADTASTLRTLMQRYVNHLDQSAFVSHMNKHFTASNRANLFATAVVSTFFGPTSTLSLCIAGHPAPLHFSAKSNAWSLLQPPESEDAANLPLGIDDLSRYENLSLTLAPNDLVLCYSDALIESHHPDGSLLGQHALLHLLNALPSPPDPATFIPTLLEKLATLHPDNLTEDDVTLLLFRPNTRPGPGFLGRAAAPLKVLAASLKSLLPNRPPAPLPDLSLPNLLGPLFPRLNKRHK